LAVRKVEVGVLYFAAQKATNQQGTARHGGLANHLSLKRTSSKKQKPVPVVCNKMPFLGTKVTEAFKGRKPMNVV
jgi:hypothetical protein